MSNIIAQPCPGTQAHARMDRQGASGRANFSGNMGFRRLRSMQRHSDRDTRLARASTDDMEMALAFLSAVDPEAFEIAFMVVEGDPASSSESAAEEEALADWEGEEATPVCRKCGSLTGIFLDRGLQWQHFRGDGITSGVQQIYDPGHEPVVTWILPDEDLAEV